MKRYLLDTSVIVGYLRDHKEAVTLIENLKGEITSSFVCLAELYEGIYRVSKKQDAERKLLTFFRGLNKVYSLNKKVAKVFGETRADLKKKGKIIEDFDLFIAATCLAYHLTLVTFNPKHFKRIEKLQVL